MVDNPEQREIEKEKQGPEKELVSLSAKLKEAKVLVTIT